MSVGDTEFNGAFEAGLGLGTPYPAPPASKLFVDNAEIDVTQSVSEKVSVVLNNNLAMSSTSTHPAFDAFDSRKYWGDVLLQGGTQGGQLTLASTAAFMRYQTSENFSLSVGYGPVPFGMEFLTGRYDMPTYYYSYAITLANNLGWMYDLGVWARITNVVPGTIEVAALDGRQLPGGDIPKGALRWHLDVNAGGLTITPVFSIYLGGFPPISTPFDEGGVTVGAQWKAGNFWANTEYLLIDQPADNTRYIGQSFVIEPGVDLGDYGISAKLDLASLKTGDADTVSDANVGLAVSRRFDGARIRATLMLANLDKRLGPDQITDFRLLFGTSW